MATWFKFYGQEYLSDPKMLSLRPTEKALWLTILCLASSSEEQGTIKHVDEQKIMTLTGFDPLDNEWKDLEGFLKRFKKLKMITIDNKVITVKNFARRQNYTLTPYERVKNFRERKKLQQEAINTPNDNEMITDDIPMITLDKNREDKNRLDNDTYVSKYKKIGGMGERNVLPAHAGRGLETLRKTVKSL